MTRGGTGLMESEASRSGVQVIVVVLRAIVIVRG